MIGYATCIKVPNLRGLTHPLVYRHKFNWERPINLSLGTFGVHNCPAER